MRLAALYSGGKDSTLALYLAEQMGHSVEHLVNIAPADPHSWLFHTPNLHLLPLMAESMGKTLVSVPSRGDEEDDLRALREALQRLDIDGVVTGAVASDYQWDRINGVCHELGLKSINPLWRKHPHLVMEELLASGTEAIVVGVSAEGLDERWLGRLLDASALQDLKKLEERHGVNVAGEGGEYESLTLDSPLHRFPIVVDASKVAMSQLSGLMRVTAFHAGVRKRT
ncbi:MAG: diphthine--ammonia ligase [Candidatus Methanomethylophilaceae archaeon]|jgi:ABC transporter with metal-binding/Fe-S-binding domain ATP-binding protein|nr:diphthine--ammonia ligase [Candidatus Methanomethylophilaceae archaeon]